MDLDYCKINCDIKQFVDSFENIIKNFNIDNEWYSAIKDWKKSIQLLMKICIKLRTC